MDGNLPEQRVQRCIILLRAWSGPGEDAAGLELVAVAIESLGWLSLRHDQIERYEVVVDAWLEFVQALEAHDSIWRQKRADVIAALEAWNLLSI